MSEPITIEEVAEFFEQNFASAMAWDFMPERKREVTAFLRSQAETIRLQGEEIAELKQTIEEYRETRRALKSDPNPTEGK